MQNHAGASQTCAGVGHIPGRCLRASNADYYARARLGGTGSLSRGFPTLNCAPLWPPLSTCASTAEKFIDGRSIRKVDLYGVGPARALTRGRVGEMHWSK